MRLRILMSAMVFGCATVVEAQAPYLVRDIWPGPIGSDVIPVAAGDRVFFGARTEQTGFELGVSAGTEATTTLLDLVPGTDSSEVQAWFALDGDLLFSSNAPSLPGLWKSDGTLGGTVQIAPVTVPGPVVWQLARLPGRVLFGGPAVESTEYEPWVTDGTADGTRKVPVPLGASPAGAPFTERGSAFGSRFAIATGFGGAWSTDGDATSTTRLVGRAVNTPNCSSTAAVGGRLVLNCRENSSLEPLAVSDGTFGGTHVLPITFPGGISAELVPAGNFAYFFAATGLYRTDGTVAGTLPVPFGAVTPTGLLLSTAVASNGVLYFGGTTPSTGRELWRTDGTAAGTFLLRDIEPGPGSGIADNGPRWIDAAAGGVVFAATTTAGGTEVWESDGTSAGTVPRPEIVPGPGSSYPNSFAAAGGRVFFQARDQLFDNELWAVDVRAGAAAVEDTTVAEPDTGTTEATFTVRLQSGSPTPVAVGYATAPVTATAGTDYETRTGVLTFAPGEREKTIVVPVLADVSYEGNESFTLALTSVGGSAIADGLGVAVIEDDDDRPVLRLTDSAFLEGTGSTTPQALAVTLSTQDGAPLVKDLAVPFTWLPGSASFLSDYFTTVGAATFPAGTASGATVSAPVQIFGDDVPEADETFTLAISSEDAGTPDPEMAVAIILDDDTAALSSRRELAHGASLRADVAASGPLPARHHYFLAQGAAASYEVVVDEVSGDATPLAVERLGSDGSTVVQTATPVGAGGALALRWRSSAAGVGEHIRVTAPVCGTACGADDTYRLRFYETTLRAPRFNNVGSQVTLVLLQNATAQPIAATVHLWATSGAAAGSRDFVLPPHGTAVHVTSVDAPVVSGSVTVSHDGPHGGLAGKAVSLDDSTGISFDTPLLPRPR